MGQQLSSSRGGSYLPPGAPSLVATLLGPANAAAGAAGAAGAAPGTPTTAAGQFGQFALVPAGGAAGGMQGGAAAPGGQVGGGGMGLSAECRSLLLNVDSGVFPNLCVHFDLAGWHAHGDRTDLQDGGLHCV